MCVVKDVVYIVFEVKNIGYINSWIKKYMNWGIDI